MISAGEILIENGTLLPQPLRLETGSQASGWAAITDHPGAHQIEKDLSTAGWTFFYMAGAIKTTAFGFDRARMTHSALKRIIADVRRQKCNCLQIDEVETRSFLGMPYVSVSAHSRHIQKSQAFSQPMDIRKRTSSAETYNIMNIRPLYDRILVKRIEEQETTRNGIIIPDSAKEKPQEGEVIAVGHGKRLDDGTVLPLDVKVGDRILFGKYSGSDTKLDGSEYIVMREDDILGVFDPAAKPAENAS